jgi:hypothetical protein
MAAKSVPGKQWGNDGSNANDAPDWQYVADGATTPNAKVDSAGATRSPAKDLFGNASANIVSTASGWELEYPDGLGGVGNRETLVAIGGLKMPALTVLFMQDLTDATDNASSGNLAVRLQMSSGVDVRTANLANVYIVAIGDTIATPNVNLAYSATLSQPESGVLVFAKNVVLTGYTGGETLTVNASSTFHGSANVVSRRKKDGVLAVSGSLPTGANAVVITIT